MSITSIIGDNTIAIGVVLVMVFVVWKFIIQPRDNEGKPIEPTEDEIETFGEKLQKNINTEVNI